jgi:hypothetical protein
MPTFAFTPTPATIFTFSPILDGVGYTCQVKWNLFAQRFYLFCFDSQSNIIFSVPLIVSPQTRPMGRLSWNSAALRAEATTASPHGFALGTIVDLTISAASPDGYNGAYACSVVSPNSFYFNLAADPGPLVSAGFYDAGMSLAAGYFNSTVVYRNGVFEVSP